MRILGLIPARGGSRRVERKNLAVLGGTTLVRRALETATAAGCFEAVAVSSEDPEILAEAAGLDVLPVERPAELAGDKARTLDVVLHALDTVEGEFDAVGIVQCTSPFTAPEDLRGAVELFERTDAGSVVTVVRLEAAVHPLKLKLLDGDRLVPWLEDDRMAPSHELPELWVRNGSLYLTRREVLENGQILAEDQRAYVMPAERSHDVDTPDDLTFARFLLQAPRSETEEVSPAGRTQFFADAHVLTPLVGVDTRHGRFVVQTDDATVGRTLFVKRARGEMRTLRFVMSALEYAGIDPRERDQAFIDVGANIGTTTIPAILRHGFSRAVAIEPEPENCRLLRANLALNGLEGRVPVIESAASADAGIASLLLNPVNTGGHRVVPANYEKSGRRKIDVPQNSLRTLTRQAGLRPRHAGLIWIDAQGHELQILRGAKSFLRRGVPLVLELWLAPLQPGDLPALLRLLGDAYSHFVDLSERPTGVEAFRPVAALEELRSSVDRRTDVLMVRAGRVLH